MVLMGSTPFFIIAAAVVVIFGEDEKVDNDAESLFAGAGAKVLPRIDVVVMVLVVFTNSLTAVEGVALDDTDDDTLLFATAAAAAVVGEEEADDMIVAAAAAS